MIVLIAPLIALVSSMMIITVIKVLPHHRKNQKFSKVTSPVVSDVKQLNTFLKINKRSYSFTYISNQVGMQEAAIDFCSNYGFNLGVTVKNFPNCVNTIVSALIHTNENNSVSGSSIITDPLTEQIDTLVIDHDESINSTLSMTNIVHSDIENKINTNSSSYRNDQHQEQREQQHPSTENIQKSATIDISLEINGLTYLFDFPIQSINPQPAAEMLALKFCQIHGQTLGLSTEDMSVPITVNQKCGQPLTSALLNEFHRESEANPNQFIIKNTQNN